MAQRTLTMHVWQQQRKYYETAIRKRILLCNDCFEHVFNRRHRSQRNIRENYFFHWKKYEKSQKLKFWIKTKWLLLREEKRRNSKFQIRLTWFHHFPVDVAMLNKRINPISWHFALKQRTAGSVKWRVAFRHRWDKRRPNWMSISWAGDARMIHALATADDENVWLIVHTVSIAPAEQRLNTWKTSNIVISDSATVTGQWSSTIDNERIITDFSSVNLGKYIFFLVFIALNVICIPLRCSAPFIKFV